MPRLFVLVELCMLILMMFVPVSASGELKCAHSSPITAPRFGVTADAGVSVTFSDIGCAMVWRSLQCSMDQAAFDSSSMVQDYGSGEAVAMQQAFFVMGCGLATPMDYDIAAFRDRGDADSFAAGKTGCRVLTYDELMAAGLK